MKKKVVIVTPKFPYPAYGACEADRAAGIELLIKLGFEVVVITKIYAEKYKDEVSATAKKLGITIIPITYKYLHNQSRGDKVLHGIKRCVMPWYLDGAAYEYSEHEIQKTLIQTLDSFKPDMVWFDYTYLWPLYRHVKKRNIPIVTRSENFEPVHFLDEEGRSIVNYLKFLPKLLSEYLSAKMSDLLFVITPNDQKTYHMLGFRKAVVLPLRGLARFVGQDSTIRDHKPLQVFFAGSTYNVRHNYAALKFLLTEVIPQANKRFPEAFTFHILGGKIPFELHQYFRGNVIKHNYLPDEEFEKLMTTMDMALIPSLYGGGMQQKIFEPITRGIPTITSSRGLAGYTFEDKKEVLIAETAGQYVDALGYIVDKERRREISDRAKKTTEGIFSIQMFEQMLIRSFEHVGIKVH